MMIRDSGWIQIFSENAEEAYDNLIQAVKIAETAALPTMVTTDGFIISHGMERIDMFDDKDVKDFVGQKKLGHYLLNMEKPITLGALDLQDYYFEHRRQLAQAMIDSKAIILNVAKDFKEKFGRSYGLFESYKLDDADIAIVVMGSTAGTAKVVADGLREKGVKAGVLKLRVFRPFPKQEIADALKNIKAVAVMDRSDTISGNEGPLALEIKAALFDSNIKKDIPDYIYGLGGREIKLEDIASIYKDLGEMIDGKIKPKVTYLGVRE